MSNPHSAVRKTSSTVVNELRSFKRHRLLISYLQADEDAPQEERQERHPILLDGLRSLWHWSDNFCQYPVRQESPTRAG